MGLRHFSKARLDEYITREPISESHSEKKSPEKQHPLEPNPDYYRVTRVEKVGIYVIMGITYPNCTNYEGRKILVFADYPNLFRDLLTHGIDPHFYNRPWSPVARFVPTEEGWDMAISFAKTSQKEKR